MKQFDVGIDVRMIDHSGIGTYLKGLTSAPDFGASKDLKIEQFGDPREGRRFSAPIYSVREQLEYPSRLRPCRLWHSPHYNIPLMKGNTRLVVTIHDLIHLVFKKTLGNPLKECYASYMLKQACHQSDHIITVSEYTKKDILRFFRIPDEKISVISEGTPADCYPLTTEDQMKRVRSEMRKVYPLPDRYFLYVGMMKAHKNVNWLLKHFIELKKKKVITSDLVLVGKKPSGDSEWLRLTKEGKSHGVFHFENVERGDLIRFYQLARALVHPSLYEGFGLTLLEAMACGTPVIASAAASLKEVAGSSAVLINPEESDDLLNALWSIENNIDVVDSLTKSGLQRAHQFNWQHTARETIQVYKKVLGQ